MGDLPYLHVARRDHGCGEYYRQDGTQVRRHSRSANLKHCLTLDTWQNRNVLGEPSKKNYQNLDIVQTSKKGMDMCSGGGSQRALSKVDFNKKVYILDL